MESCESQSCALEQTHLKSNTAAIEATLMHGGILSQEALTEATFLLEEEVAMAIVMKQSLS